MTAIFGGNTGKGSEGSGARSANLVEFKAGKMSFDGKSVKPDNRKGLFYMRICADSILHVHWKERSSESTPEDDFIIWPNEVEFVRIDPSKAKRVFMLKWKEASAKNRVFYWMQEPDAAKDDILWQKVEGLCKSASGSSLKVDSSSADLMNLALGMDRNELYELLQRIPSGAELSIGPITVRNVDGNQRLITHNTRSQTQRSRRQVQNTTGRLGLELLRSTIEGFRKTQSSGQEQRIKYQEFLKTDRLKPVLDDPPSLSALIDHLPEGVEHTRDGVELALRSPQVMMRLREVLTLITSGSFSPEQFGIKPNDRLTNACTSGDLSAFAEAFESIDADPATVEVVRIAIADIEREMSTADSIESEDDDRVVIDEEDDGSSEEDDEMDIE